MNQFELSKLFAQYGATVFKLDHKEFAAFLSILSHWRSDTNECWPSNDTVCRGCGLSSSNLSKQKAALKKAGICEDKLDKKLGDGKKHSNYTIHHEFIIKKIFEYIAEREAEEASREAAKLNQSSADLFEPEPEHQQAPIEEESNPLEASPINPSEPVSAPDEPAYTEPVITPYSGLQGYSGLSQYFTDVDELKRAVVAHAGLPNEIQKSEWKQSLKDNGYITASQCGENKTRFCLIKDE